MEDDNRDDKQVQNQTSWYQGVTDSAKHYGSATANYAYESWLSTLSGVQLANQIASVGEFLNTGAKISENVRDIREAILHGINETHSSAKSYQDESQYQPLTVSAPKNADTIWAIKQGFWAASDLLDKHRWNERIYHLLDAKPILKNLTEEEFLDLQSAIGNQYAKIGQATKLTYQKIGFTYTEIEPIKKALADVREKALIRARNRKLTEIEREEARLLSEQCEPLKEKMNREMIHWESTIQRLLRRSTPFKDLTLDEFRKLQNALDETQFAEIKALDLSNTDYKTVELFRSEVEMIQKAVGVTKDKDLIAIAQKLQMNQTPRDKTEPFTEYLNDSAQILQLKRILNGLYHMEIALEEIEKPALQRLVNSYLTAIDSEKSWLLQRAPNVFSHLFSWWNYKLYYSAASLVNHGYRGSHLLLQVEPEFLGAFAPEWRQMKKLVEAKGVTGFFSWIGKFFEQTPTELFNRLGYLQGLLLDQLRPVKAGGADYPLVMRLAGFLGETLEEKRTYLDQYFKSHESVMSLFDSLASGSSDDAKVLSTFKEVATAAIQQNPQREESRLRELNAIVAKLSRSYGNLESEGLSSVLNFIHYFSIIWYASDLINEIYKRGELFSDSTEAALKRMIVMLRDHYGANLVILSDKIEEAGLFRQGELSDWITKKLGSYYDLLRKEKREEQSKQADKAEKTSEETLEAQGKPFFTFEHLGEFESSVFTAKRLRAARDRRVTYFKEEREVDELLLPALDQIFGVDAVDPKDIPQLFRILQPHIEAINPKLSNEMLVKWIRTGEYRFDPNRYKTDLYDALKARLLRIKETKKLSTQLATDLMNAIAPGRSVKENLIHLMKDIKDGVHEARTLDAVLKPLGRLSPEEFELLKTVLGRDYSIIRHASPENYKSVEFQAEYDAKNTAASDKAARKKVLSLKAELKEPIAIKRFRRTLDAITTKKLVVPKGKTESPAFQALRPREFHVLQLILRRAFKKIKWSTKDSHIATGKKFTRLNDNNYKEALFNSRDIATIKAILSETNIEKELHLISKKITVPVLPETIIHGHEYHLALMSSLEGDLTKAQNNVVYLSENPKAYFVKGMDKPIPLGQAVDVKKLEEKLKDTDFKEGILAITSKAGHTSTSKLKEASPRRADRYLVWHEDDTEAEKDTKTAESSIVRRVQSTIDSWQQYLTKTFEIDYGGDMKSPLSMTLITEGLKALSESFNRLQGIQDADPNSWDPFWGKVTYVVQTIVFFKAWISGVITATPFVKEVHSKYKILSETAEEKKSELLKPYQDIPKDAHWSYRLMHHILTLPYQLDRLSKGQGEVHPQKAAKIKKEAKQFEGEVETLERHFNYEYSIARYPTLFGDGLRILLNRMFFTDTFDQNATKAVSYLFRTVYKLGTEKGLIALNEHVFDKFLGYVNSIEEDMTLKPGAFSETLQHWIYSWMEGFCEPLSMPTETYYEVLVNEAGIHKRFATRNFILEGLTPDEFKELKEVLAQNSREQGANRSRYVNGLLKDATEKNYTKIAFTDREIKRLKEELWDHDNLRKKLVNKKELMISELKRKVSEKNVDRALNLELMRILKSEKFTLTHAAELYKEALTEALRPIMQKEIKGVGGVTEEVHNKMYFPHPKGIEAVDAFDKPKQGKKPQTGSIRLKAINKYLKQLEAEAQATPGYLCDFFNIIKSVAKNETLKPSERILIMHQLLNSDEMKQYIDDKTSWDGLEGAKRFFIWLFSCFGWCHSKTPTIEALDGLLRVVSPDTLEVQVFDELYTSDYQRLDAMLGKIKALEDYLEEARIRLKERGHDTYESLATYEVKLTHIKHLRKLAENTEREVSERIDDMRLYMQKPNFTGDMFTYKKVDDWFSFEAFKHAVLWLLSCVGLYDMPGTKIHDELLLAADKKTFFANTPLIDVDELSKQPASEKDRNWTDESVWKRLGF